MSEQRNQPFMQDPEAALERIIEKMADKAEEGSSSHLSALSMAFRDFLPYARSLNELARMEDWRRLEYEARHSLQAFTRLTKADYQVAGHHQMMFMRIQDAAEADSGRIYIGMPPRHGKSEICSVRLPVWWLGNRPDSRVLLIAATQALANFFSRQARDMVLGSPVYRRLFPELELSAHARRVDDWQTTAGGGMKAVGAGGNVSGHGCDLLIIDDPHRDEDWLNDEVMQRTFEWYVSAARRRLSPGASVVLLMTRWHERDLAGRLLELPDLFVEAERFDELVLPALAEADDPLGREEGDALWPERYDEAALAAHRAPSEQIWQSQYQQNPQAFSDYLFRDGDLVWVDRDDVPLSEGKLFWTGDMAYAMSERADYNVLAYWHWGLGKLTLLDLRRYRGNIDTTINVIEQLLGQYESMKLFLPDDPVEELNKPPLRSRFPTDFLQLPTVETGIADKRVKAQAAVALAAEGRLQLVKGVPQVDYFAREVTRFPNYSHDDCVDTLSLAAMQGKESEFGWTFSGGAKGFPMGKRAAESPLDVGTKHMRRKGRGSESK